MYQERIRKIYEHLSPSYRRVADFLLDHYRDAAFMTAVEVGRATNVDTTSVVRFAQRLGYPGYPELVAEVQEEVKRDLRSVYEPPPEEKSVRAIFQRSLMQDRDSIDYMLLHTRLDVVQQVVELLETAQRIYVVGESSAHHMASVFALRMASLGFAAQVLPGDMLGRVAMTVALKRGDALMAIGATISTPGVTAVTRVAAEEGVHTIAVVSSPANPVAAVAEHVLYAPADSTGFMHSLTAMASVLHALLQALTMRMEDRAAEWIMRADHLARRFHQVWQEPMVSMRDVLSDFHRRAAAE